MTPPRLLSLLSVPLITLASAGSSSAQVVQTDIRLTVSNATLLPGTSGQQVSISLENVSGSALTIYSGGFSVQVGDGSGYSGTAPVITGVSMLGQAGGPFTVSNTSFQLNAPTSDWLYEIQFSSEPATSPVTISSGSSFTFATVTLATTASLGSWSLQIGNNVNATTPDPYFSVSTDSDMANVQAVNGTLSAVPEPEETMAVMAGLSLGLGWWIRRRRAKGAQSGAPGGGTGQCSR